MSNGVNVNAYFYTSPLTPKSHGINGSLLIVYKVDGHDINQLLFDFQLSPAQGWPQQVSRMMCLAQFLT